MAGRITIDVGLNTRDVAKGAKDGERALENLEDAVRDAGSGGAKGLEKLEDELKDVQRQSERTDRSLDDMGGTSNRSFDQASENVRNFKSEAVQNLSEVASSWEGDLQGMADGVQGLTGGLASALTPGIGIPVAVLGAAAAAFFANWQQAAEDSEQRISDMYAAFIESGTSFVSEDQIAKAIREIQDDTAKWADAQQRVKDTGTDIGTVLRAMAGDQNAIATVHAEYVRQRDLEIEKIRQAGYGIEEEATAIDAANAKFGEQVEWISQIQRDTNTAVDKANAYRDALNQSLITAQQLAAAVNGIQNRSIEIGVKVNDAAFASWWASAQRRAAQGITVTAKPGSGRFWE